MLFAIEAFVATLKRESLGESMDRLISDNNQYHFPGYNSDVMYAQLDLETMLSTRRSIKVLQSIERFSEKEREKKCEQLFAKAFNAHNNAFNNVLRHQQDPSRPENQQSFTSTKGALDCAMFITANNGSANLLLEQLDQLLQFRNEMSARFLSNTPAPPKGFMSVFEDLVVPDNRFQVNVLRLAAAKSGNVDLLKKVDAECDGVKMIRGEIPIVAWDARTTWFDVLVRSPMDTSKGVSTFTVLDWHSSGDLILRKDMQHELILKLISIIHH